MEYQFISDPTWGITARFSDEHKLIARWLTDERIHQRYHELAPLIKAAEQGKTHVFKGKEIQLTLTQNEALFQSHGLFYDDADLAQWQDDQLDIDNSELTAVCGLTDFIEMLTQWLAFNR